MTFDIGEEKRKRHRRTAPEIARHYKCPNEDCPKSYGSEGSLNQHLKLKHKQYYEQLMQSDNAAQYKNMSMGSSIKSQDDEDNGQSQDQEDSSFQNYTLGQD